MAYVIGEHGWEQVDADGNTVAAFTDIEFDNTPKTYVSEIIDSCIFEHDAFNLISSGTGTGKTEFVRRKLTTMLNVRPDQVIYVTSRSMVRDQQSLMDGIERYSADSETIENWNLKTFYGEQKAIADMNIRIMTYNQFISYISFGDETDGYSMENVRVILFDECHTMFTDTFITDVSIIPIWLRSTIRNNDSGVVIIGMTATPNVVVEHCSSRHINVHMVNDVQIVNYRAKHLVVSEFSRIDMVLRDLLYLKPGKTIIMLHSVKDCVELHERFPESVVVISANHVRFTKQMSMLRDYIVDNNSIPDDTSLFGGVDEVTGQPEPVHMIKYVFCTSAMREGLNIVQSSGVRNVVCAFNDEVHIKQFLGRCRYNVDWLIVLHRGVRHIAGGDQGFVAHGAKMLSDFIEDESSREWFDTISDVVGCGFEDIIRYRIDKDDETFLNHVEWMFLGRWLTDDEIKMMIYDAFVCSLFGSAIRSYTLQRVLRYLENVGYTVERHRMRRKTDKNECGFEDTVHYRILKGE